MLASVADLDEAMVAVEQGADLVDLKDPTRGALGAWPVESVRAAVEALGDRALLSATVGDLPVDPESLVEAARRMAATGVAIVKIGFFAASASLDELAAAVRALAAVTAEGTRLVAVLMADQELHLPLLPMLASAGFKGAMLDTADKAAGPLSRHLSAPALADFVDRVRRLSMLCGLAGSLRQSDIAPLAALAPDYLGFRGALCGAGRTSRLDPLKLAAIRQAVRAASNRATATAGKQVATDEMPTSSSAGIRLAAAR
ncbi:Uncharacterized protein, UPF0264 family [Arboricoccus pini]|uniref:(5-formylfuran-3-yl)methyl phosphate synthase n=2 Tax=Arboricoccus pini TaxID=1963835 RepID=A0A212RZX8_9PROT|nr:Uncharacterized protein, UPF0264 family [Arboricoccus pini]